MPPPTVVTYFSASAGEDWTIWMSEIVLDALLWSLTHLQRPCPPAITVHGARSGYAASMRLSGIQGQESACASGAARQSASARDFSAAEPALRGEAIESETRFMDISWWGHHGENEAGGRNERAR